MRDFGRIILLLRWHLLTDSEELGAFRLSEAFKNPENTVTVSAPPPVVETRTIVLHLFVHVAVAS